MRASKTAKPRAAPVHDARPHARPFAAGSAAPVGTTTTLPAHAPWTALLTLVGESQKAWLHAHCQAFVFPSLTEGCGLPPIAGHRPERAAQARAWARRHRRAAAVEGHLGVFSRLRAPARKPADA
jgi:hypothetical protein